MNHSSASHPLDVFDNTDLKMFRPLVGLSFLLLDYRSKSRPLRFDLL